MESIENKDLFSLFSLFSWSLNKEYKENKDLFSLFSLFTFPGVQQDGIYRK